jgi:hypothetical protein
MILEAFSRYLHTAAPNLSASQVLSLWLWERLASAPKNMVDQVIHCEVEVAASANRKAVDNASNYVNPDHPRTIRLPEDAELALRLKSQTRGQNQGREENAAADPRESESNPEYIKDSRIYFFKGTSTSGSRLLNSLYEYAMSYEQLKWSRFIHSVKASDFKLR